MGIIFNSKRAKHRKFDYQPRFHNPEKEKKLRERIRIQSRASRRRSPVGIIYALVLLTFAAFLYFNF
ncbi:MAG: hypothetical protein AAF564_19445 [Bacteroidota bacterium]